MRCVLNTTAQYKRIGLSRFHFKTPDKLISSICDTIQTRFQKGNSLYQNRKHSSNVFNCVVKKKEFCWLFLLFQLHLTLAGGHQYGRRCGDLPSPSSFQSSQSPTDGSIRTFQGFLSRVVDATGNTLEVAALHC